MHLYIPQLCVGECEVERASLARPNAVAACERCLAKAVISGQKRIQEIGARGYKLGGREGDR
jgi:hypothetical protein